MISTLHQEVRFYCISLAVFYFIVFVLPDSFDQWLLLLLKVSAYLFKERGEVVALVEELDVVILYPDDGTRRADELVSLNLFLH